MLTVDLVSRTVPPSLKRSVTQSLVDQLNNIHTDPDIAAAMRENFLSYTKVLGEGRFKIEDYINAVKFVSFKLMSMSNKDAYIRTFPQRYQDLMAAGADEKILSSYVSMYAKGKLVNLILEQSMVPTWVLNQDIHQRAINQLAELMVNAKSEMVQATAANSILLHLKKPDAAAGPLVNINMPESSGVKELQATLTQLALQQKQLIEQGVSPRTIAAQSIVEAEVEPA